MAIVLQRCPPPFPITSQFSHQFEKARIVPDILKRRVSIVQRVAGEPIPGCCTQPTHRLLRSVHERIGSADGVGGVMEVTEIFPLLDGRFNTLFSKGYLPRVGIEQRLHSVTYAARIGGLVN